MRLGSSSLQRVQFDYGPSPNTAAVNFSADKGIVIELSHKNPHHRVLKLLTEIANDRVSTLPVLEASDATGLDRFCTTLILTRSILKSLRDLESRTPGNIRNPAVHVHSIFKYRLTYENPICTFDLRLQAKDDTVYWLIEDNFRTRGHDTRPTPERGQNHRRLDSLQATLKPLFASKGASWFGTRNGIVAELDGVPNALRSLDEAVLSCKMEGGYKAPPPLEQPAPQQVQPNGVQHPNQQVQQARMQQLQQQQQLQARQQQQQQLAQGQQKRQNLQLQQQAGQRGQQGNGGRGPVQQQQGRLVGRPGQSKQDVIEID